MDTIEGFQYCFNKYWSSSQQVIILGYTSPTFKLNDNFKFISLGEDRGADYIGGDLINLFQNIDDNHFIFSVDDFLLIRYVVVVFPFVPVIPIVPIFEDGLLKKLFAILESASLVFLTLISMTSEDSFELLFFTIVLAFRNSKS